MGMMDFIPHLPFATSTLLHKNQTTILFWVVLFLKMSGPWTSFFFFFNLFIYFGCVGSSFLCEGFL